MYSRPKHKQRLSHEDVDINNTFEKSEASCSTSCFHDWLFVCQNIISIKSHVITSISLGEIATFEMFVA